MFARAWIVALIPPLLRCYLNQIFLENHAENDIQVHFIKEKNDVKKIAELTQLGMKIAHSNKDFRQEMSRWIVNNYTRRRDGMIGYSMNMPGPISLLVSKVVRFFNMGKIMGKLNYMSVSSAPLICVFTAPDLKTETWLKIGRLVERLTLELQKENFSTSIYLASVEMGDLYKEIQNILKTSSLPQFVFASGFMDKTFKTTPRHELEEKLLN